MKKDKDQKSLDWEPVRKTSTGMTYVSFGKESSGFSIEGTYKGRETGAYGLNVVMDTLAGEVRFTHSVGMQDLDLCTVGDHIKIMFDGKKKTADGARTFNAFTVFRQRST